MRSMLMRTIALMGVMALVVAVAACEIGDDNDKREPAADDPRPPKEVVPNSPEATVERLWRWIRVGSPTAITTYDRAFVRSAGRADVTGALTTLRETVTKTKLSFTGSEGTAIGTQVTVRQTAKGAEPRNSVYILIRRDDEWVIAYDGLLADTLVARASSRAAERVQRKINPKAKEASPSAQSASAIAGAKAKRELFDAIDTSPPTSETPTKVEPARTPRAALERLWSRIRLGSPAAITSYSRRLVKRLGSTDVLIGLQNQRGSLMTSRLEITDLEGTKVGTLATVRLTPKGDEARDYAYVLDRPGGDWLASYDAVLGDTLVGTATSDATIRAQSRIDPNAKAASAAAQAAGSAAGERVQRKLSALAPAVVRGEAP